MMAGAGIAVPGQLSYQDFCGLYFLRHQIQHERREDLKLSLTYAIRMAWP